MTSKSSKVKSLSLSDKDWADMDAFIAQNTAKPAQSLTIEQKRFLQDYWPFLTQEQRKPYMLKLFNPLSYRTIRHRRHDAIEEGLIEDKTPMKYKRMKKVK
jgi:hypothetical protein